VPTIATHTTTGGGRPRADDDSRKRLRPRTAAPRSPPTVPPRRRPRHNVFVSNHLWVGGPPDWTTMLGEHYLHAFAAKPLRRRSRQTVCRLQQTTQANARRSRGLTYAPRGQPAVSKTMCGCCSAGRPRIPRELGTGPRPAEQTPESDVRTSACNTCSTAAHKLQAEASPSDPGRLHASAVIRTSRPGISTTFKYYVDQYATTRRLDPQLVAAAPPPSN